MKQIIRRINLILGCFLVLCFAGCGSKEEETEELVIVDTQEEAGIYSMVTAANSDVILTGRLDLEYVQASEQEVALESGGRKIVKVCVKKGDKVNAGDMLLKLDEDNLEEQIENVSYQIKTNELQLGYLDTYEAFDKEQKYQDYVFGSGLETEDELKALEKDIAVITCDYKYKREDLEDAIEFGRLELAELENKQAGARVYSSISGVVIKIEDNLEGATTKKDQVIMTIADDSHGYFKAINAEAASAINKEDILTMNISYGDGAGDYDLKPFRYEEWGEEQYFEILSAPETAVLQVGTRGTLTLVIDRRDNVLSIPSKCVHVAGDDRYVYTLNDQGLKTVRYVEIGLEGDNLTEITDGLTAGEQVVSR